MKRLFFVVSLFFLIGMGPSLQGNNADGISPLNSDKIVSSKAPDFALKDLNGKTVSLSSLRGKVVLLNFFATWCPPCRAEMPALNRLYKTLKPRGLEIYGISTDRPGDIKDFLEGNKIDFPVVLDSDRSASKKYRVFSMPSTFLIDKNGMLIEKFYGEYDWTEPETKGKIEKLLQK